MLEVVVQGVGTAEPEDGPLQLPSRPAPFFPLE